MRVNNLAFCESSYHQLPLVTRHCASLDFHFETQIKGLPQLAEPLQDRDENAPINIETEGLRIPREPENAAGVTPERVRAEERGSCRRESTGQALTL